MSDASSRSTSSPHWPALDGLRGLAVAGVVAYHLGGLPGGFLGVDLFFVLSGFLITSLLVDEVARTGRVRLIEFWGRRFRRLLPAVTVMIALAAMAVAAWGSAADQAAARGDAPWALGYLANWHQIVEAHDYWAASAASSVFKHLWSLAIEEQFYVVWPIVVWALLRRGGRVAVVVTVAAATASAVWSAVLAGGSDPGRSYLGTDTRAVSLLTGALIALPLVRERTTSALRRARDLHGRRLRAAIDVTAVGLLASWALAGDQVGALLRGGLTAHALGGAFLVAAVTSMAPATRPSLLERACSSVPLVWLGRRSYGVYLWHWPLIVLASTRWAHLDGWAKGAGVVAATLVLAVLSYELLEQPIRRRGGWAAGARTARLATATCVLAAIVAITIAPDGRGDVAPFTLPASAPAAATTSGGSTEPQRTASGSNPAGTSPPDGIPATPAGTTPVGAVPEGSVPEGSGPLPAPAAARAPAPGGSTPAPARAPAASPVTAVADAPAPGPAITSVLWIGDSVAADEAPAVLAAFAAAGLPGTDGAWAGRRFVESDGVVPADIFPPLIADAGADLVVVQLSLWDAPFPIDTLRTSFRWFLDLVAPSDAQVLFLTPPPVREDLVDPGMERQVEVVRELVASDPDHVRMLDTSELWGHHTIADMDGDGAPDRKPDLVHVCPQGAARFATWLIERLADEYSGFTPAAPSEWLGGPWSSDARYDTPVGACAALSASAD